MKLFFKCFFCYIEANLIIIAMFLCYSIYCYWCPEEWYSNFILHYFITALVLCGAENRENIIKGSSLVSFFNKVIIVFLVINLLEFIAFWLSDFLSAAFGAYRTRNEIMAGNSAPYSPNELMIRSALNMFMESLLYSACSLLLYLPAWIDYKKIKSVKMSFERWPVNFVVFLVVSLLFFLIKYGLNIIDSHEFLAVSSGVYVCAVPLMSFVMGKIEYELELKQHYEVK